MRISVMLLTCFVATGMAVLASSSQVVSLDTGEVTRIHCFPEGKSFRFSVYEDDLDASPKWANPESTRPPLSLQDAVEVARSELPAYVSKPKRWFLDQVTLEAVPDQPGHWYYVVDWLLQHSERTEAVTIPVLMNGKAIVGELDAGYLLKDEDG